MKVNFLLPLFLTILAKCSPCAIDIEKSGKKIGTMVRVEDDTLQWDELKGNTVGIGACSLVECSDIKYDFQSFLFPRWEPPIFYYFDIKMMGDGTVRLVAEDEKHLHSIHGEVTEMIELSKKSNIAAVDINEMAIEITGSEDWFNKSHIKIDKATNQSSIVNQETKEEYPAGSVAFSKLHFRPLQRKHASKDKSPVQFDISLAESDKLAAARLLQDYGGQDRVFMHLIHNVQSSKLLHPSSFILYPFAHVFALLHDQQATESSSKPNAYSIKNEDLANLQAFRNALPNTFPIVRDSRPSFAADVRNSFFNRIPSDDIGSQPILDLYFGPQFNVDHSVDSKMVLQHQQKLLDLFTSEYTRLLTTLCEGSKAKEYKHAYIYPLTQADDIPVFKISVTALARALNRGRQECSLPPITFVIPSSECLVPKDLVYGNIIKQQVFHIIESELGN